MAASLLVTLIGCSAGSVQRSSADAPAALRLSTEAVTIQMRDVEYLQVDGKTFQATIYQPQGTGPFPALLDVHGGN